MSFCAMEVTQCKGPAFDEICRAACRLLMSPDANASMPTPPGDHVPCAWPLEGTARKEDERPILLLEDLLTLQAPGESLGHASASQAPDDSFAFGQLHFGFGRSDVLALTRGPAALACFQTFLHTCSPQDRAWFAGRECRTSVCQGASLLCYTDGSFTPARGDQPALMGWAVAFFRRAEDVHDRLTCLGVASGPFPSFLQDEVHLPTAFLAECCALCYAALLNVVLFPGLDVVFVSDCGCHSLG